MSLLKNSFIKASALMCCVSAISFSVVGQDAEVERKMSEDDLRAAIAARFSVVYEINKPRELADTLAAQVDDYRELVELLDNRVDSLGAVIARAPKVDYSVWPLPLLSEDVSVFRIENLAGRSVPPALQPHYDVVCSVAKIDSLMNKTQYKVAEIITFAENNNLDAQPMIGPAISGYVGEMLDMLKALGKTSELVTLSPVQKQYVAELKQSYNDLSKYFQ